MIHSPDFFTFSGSYILNLSFLFRLSKEEGGANISASDRVYGRGPDFANKSNHKFNWIFFIFYDICSFASQGGCFAKTCWSL